MQNLWWSLAVAIKSAKLVNGLWRESDMSHHRDSLIHQTAYNGGGFNIAFKFNSLASGFLKNSDGSPQSSFRISGDAKRKIADDERALSAANDRGGMANHIVQSDRNCGVVTEDDIAKTVAYQNYFNSGFFDQSGSDMVIGGQHRDFLTLLIQGFDVSEGEALGLRAYGHAAIATMFQSARGGLSS